LYSSPGDACRYVLQVNINWHTSYIINRALTTAIYDNSLMTVIGHTPGGYAPAAAIMSTIGFFRTAGINSIYMYTIVGDKPIIGSNGYRHEPITTHTLSS